MEKKKNHKPLRKIAAIVSIVSVLLAMLSLSVAASSVSYTDMEVYSPSMPLNRIEVTNLRASNVATIRNYFVTESPFSVYYGGSAVTGKTGVVFNYPVQESFEFTSTGRTLFYSYSLGVPLDNVVSARFVSPISYSDGSVSPFVFDNSQSVIYHFDDFVLGSSDYFTLNHSISQDVNLVLPIYNISFDVISLGDGKYITQSFAFNLSRNSLSGGVLNLTFDVLSDNLSYFYSYDLEQDSLISNLKVEFKPRGGSTVNVGDVTDVEILCSMQDADSLYSDITEWYTRHSIVKEVFVGLGDLSLFDWLGVAIGGFFDFEIAPKFSLGGVLLVVIGLGLLTFIIKVFK